MYERILVTLDGSDLSNEILEAIEDLAPKLGSRVYLVRILPVLTATPVAFPGGAAYIPAPPPEDEMEEALQDALEYLEEEAADLREDGVPVETIVRFGSPAQEIVQLAQELHADLIAMSTRGRSGLARFVLGSVCEQVLREAQAPVLAVAPREED